MKPDEVLRLAHEARSLLGSSAFKRIVDLTRSHLLQDILNSRYEDTDQREAAYRRIIALDDIVTTMQSLALHAEVYDQPEMEV